MRDFESVADLMAARGETLGHTAWLTIGAEQVAEFAEATGDGHWVHLDEARAARASSRGALVPGFLTLALIGGFGRELFRIQGADMIVNYGLNQVRFVGPIRTGTPVRARASVVDAFEVPGAVQVVTSYEFEAEPDEPRLVCVAEHVNRHYYNMD